jgi:hypothetical protein
MSATLKSMAVAIALCASSAGCGFDRPGTWRAAGSNDANLRAMLVDPSHLTRGVGTTTSRGPTAAQAIIRLDEDRRRPLPDSRAAQIGSLATQAPSGGGSGGGGPGGN